MRIKATLAAALLLAAAQSQASLIPVATYLFDGNLNAEEAGVAANAAMDPAGLNQFQVENVFGTNQTVYRFDGSTTPSLQSGLVLDTTGILDGDDTYSVDITFRFDNNGSSWENIFGVSNRQSDNAFYVAPSGGLQVWPSSLGPDVVTQNEWHRVTLANNGSTVVGYLDGVFQFDLNTPSMNFSSYTSQNPGRLMHFFLDNVVGGGQGEFAAGAIASLRLYDIELTEDEVDNLPVPAPMTLLLFGAGLVLVGRVAKNR